MDKEMLQIVLLISVSLLIPICISVFNILYTCKYMDNYSKLTKSCIRILSVFLIAFVLYVFYDGVHYCIIPQSLTKDDNFFCRNPQMPYVYAGLCSFTIVLSLVLLTITKRLSKLTH